MAAKNPQSEPLLGNRPLLVPNDFVQPKQPDHRRMGINLKQPATASLLRGRHIEIVNESVPGKCLDELHTGICVLLRCVTCMTPGIVSTKVLRNQSLTGSLPCCIIDDQRGVNRNDGSGV